MYLLKLFEGTASNSPLHARVLSPGVTRVGRDEAADWSIADPTCEISRSHFELHLQGSSLVLKPLGSNGIFLEGDQKSLPAGEEVPLTVGDRFRFGRFSMLVGAYSDGLSPNLDQACSTISSGAQVEGAPGPDEVASLAPSSQPPLLEAFCEGARIDPSFFAAEDPVQVMRDIGAVYHEIVVGLATLISERSSARDRSQLNRTTINAQDNNLFKWAPAQKVAIDLLLNRHGGFLHGADAIRASIDDIKQHLSRTAAGYRYAMLAMVEMTRPERICEGLERKGLLQSRDAAAWSAFQSVHARLAREVTENREGSLSQAFATGYDRSLCEQTGPAANPEED